MSAGAKGGMHDVMEANNHIGNLSIRPETGYEGPEPCERFLRGVP